MWHITEVTRDINIFLKNFKKNSKKFKKLKNQKIKNKIIIQKKEKLTHVTYLTVLVFY